jgi:hypothetical protein
VQDGVAAAWCGGAGLRGMVIDGGGVMRTVWRHKVNGDGTTQKVEDE